MKKIATSILSADFGRLAEEIQAVEKAGATAFVAGSAVFKSPDCKKSITALRENSR